MAAPPGLGCSCPAFLSALSSSPLPLEGRAGLGKGSHLFAQLDPAKPWALRDLGSEIEHGAPPWAPQELSGLEQLGGHQEWMRWVSDSPSCSVVRGRPPAAEWWGVAPL